MRITLHNHQDKGRALARAISSQGHNVVPTNPDLLLIDHDGPEYYRSIINHVEPLGVPVWLYSHGAMSCMAWDGWWESHPHTGGYLAVGEGNKEIMTRYGYDREVRVIGWYWCGQMPQTQTTPHRVLFAPIHPLGNGFMRPEAREANRRAYAELLEQNIMLTVRHIGSLGANGLWPVPGVRYEQGRPDNSIVSIDKADVVVSWGTFAFLAIARGRPTVMYGQDVVPGDGHNADDMRYVQSWSKYRDILRYPLELFDSGPTADILKAAAAGQIDITDWRARFIGEQLNPEKLCKILEEVVSGARIHV